MFKRMKIAAPTKSLEMTQLQVNVGADEVYLGLSDNKYSTFTFNGRFKEMNTFPVQVNSLEELDSIVDVCRENSMKVSFAANTHYIAPGLEDEYIEYVYKGVSAGVDYLIVSNMGLIKLIRKHGITLPVIAGTYTFIPNVEHLKMLKDMGVKRVILPHALTIDEIRTFCAVEGIEIEILCFMGAGNNCGRCMLLHSDHMGMCCRGGYRVDTLGESKTNNYFMDAAVDCALCSIPALIEAGVDMIRVVGRESPNPTVNSKIVYLFRQFISGYYEGKSINQIKKELSMSEMMWK
ncbi:MAG TPA: peptidase U32 family protein [Clostridia bacterium]|nr:peptidase U32 family protein [Clostridia bacterium]